MSAPITAVDGYKATNVAKENVSELWNLLKKSSIKSSICSNRAMVWNYEMKQQYDVDSKKIFIHYTNIYQLIGYNEGRHISKAERYFRTKLPGSKIWVYHVAPSIVVDGQDIVLDKQYRDGPVTALEWEAKYTRKIDKLLNNVNSRTEIIERLKKSIDKYRNSSRARSRMRFTQSRNAYKMIQEARQADGTYKTSCKRITAIAEHHFDEKAWCHTQLASMYYWTPGDLRKINYNTSNLIYEDRYTPALQAKAAKHKITSFRERVINISYDQAFEEEEEEEEEE